MVESITIRNKRNNEELVMDKLTTPNYILDYADWGQASVDQFTAKFINQFGVSIVGISFKSREIEISGFAVATEDDEMSKRKRFLNGFFNPQSEYEVVYKNYKIAFRPTTSVRYANVDESNNNEVMCRFKISGVCPYPLFSLDSISTIYVGEFISSFHFPFYMTEEEPVTFAIRSIGDYRQRIIKNNGHIETGIKFYMEAKDEPVDTPTLYNFTTNQFFKIEKLLRVGERIEINTETGYKSVIGSYGGVSENYLKYKSQDSSWLTFIQGENMVGYGAERGMENLDIRIEVPEKYLEVQECF